LFVELGSTLLCDWDIFIAVLPQTLLLTAGIMLFQVLSAGAAARYTAGFSFADSLLIGLGMMGRAELAFVVIDIAYVHYSIFSIEAFYTLMFSCFILNLAVPLSILLWKSHYRED